MTVVTEEDRVSETMRHGTLSCRGEDSLRTVAGLMAQHRVHSVVVTDLDGASEHAWGVVTDADVVRAFAEDVDRLTAREIAGTELLTVCPEEALERAAQLMAEHEVSHLVVVDRGTDRPVGVLSRLDVAAQLAAR